MSMFANKLFKWLNIFYIWKKVWEKYYKDYLTRLSVDIVQNRKKVLILIQHFSFRYSSVFFILRNYMSKPTLLLHL